MASYCPKANSYSTSELANDRFACAVGHNNLGADYALKVCQKMNVTYIKKMINYCAYATKKGIKRLNPDPEPCVKTLRKHNEIENHLNYNTQNVAYVFFLVWKPEAFSAKRYSLDCHEKRNKLLSMYLTLVKNIDPTSSAVTGLSKNGRQLFLHDEPLSTLSHKQAALKILEYSQSFALVSGFVDTLPLLRKQFSDRKNNKLPNTTVNIDILEKLTGDDNLRSFLMNGQNFFIKSATSVNKILELLNYLKSLIQNGMLNNFDNF
ncbi:hypothetical protein PV327_001896 [Microctonus hyperodae]|uniref:Uncharacterized protein n=1 Tax=Microctonus hyperodae TaxID=165561 RepID=A0AA39KNP5_MICHY|nr:hypothetical protein PV327_001896 [Microctonus hyperodae]